MVLVTSARYVNPELQSEFGKIPPSFLPLGGKRLYEYQVKLFENSNEKVVLSVPDSFKITQSDKKKLELLKVSILFIPDELSLGESIVYAVNMNLPIDGALEILHGDTYFEQLETSSNSVSTSKVESNYDWAYLIEGDTPLLNTAKNGINTLNNLILSGYFNIANPYKLVQSIVQSKYSFIDGLKLYSQEFPFNIIVNNTWLDFGLVSNYFHSKKSITTERAFNQLIIENGYVIKSSTLAGKLDGEINWFKRFPQELSLYIPRFYAIDNGLSYKTEYLYISTLSELFVFGKLPSHVWKQIFKSLKTFLEKLHTISTEDTKINFNYIYKTNLRIEQFSLDHNIDLNKNWIFNGTTMPSINFIIKDLNNYITTNDVSYKFIHGDFCFSNIMYDFKSNEIKTFDPRGMDFENKTSVFGDTKYDFAKLMHSVIGLYDFVISGFYTCNLDDYTIEYTIDITDEIKLIQESFFDIFEFKNREEIYAVMIHLFASMLPLHDDDINKQNALLANMFRLYKNLKEGI